METTNPAEGRFRELLRRAILNGLESFREPHRHVFVRSHYGGESIKRISASMGLGEQEVRSMLQECDLSLCRSVRVFLEDTPEPHPSHRC